MVSFTEEQNTSSFSFFTEHDLVQESVLPESDDEEDQKEWTKEVNCRLINGSFENGIITKDMGVKILVYMTTKYQIFL